MLFSYKITSEFVIATFVIPELVIISPAEFVAMFMLNLVQKLSRLSHHVPGGSQMSKERLTNITNENRRPVSISNFRRLKNKAFRYRVRLSSQCDGGLLSSGYCMT